MHISSCILNLSFSHKIWTWPNVLALRHIIPVLSNFIEFQEWYICNKCLTSFTIPKAFPFLAWKRSERFLKRVFTTDTFLLWEIYKSIMQKYRRECMCKTRPERYSSDISVRAMCQQRWNGYYFVWDVEWWWRYMWVGRWRQSEQEEERQYDCTPWCVAWIIPWAQVGKDFAFFRRPLMLEPP